jgi:hypothetical protein
MWKHHKIAKKYNHRSGPKKQTLIPTDLKKVRDWNLENVKNKLRILSLTYLMGNNNMKFWEKKNRQNWSARK